MTLLSKIIELIVTLLFLTQVSCLNWPEPEPDAFTSGAQIFVNRILLENPGATYDVNIVDTDAGHGFSEPIGYLLGLIVEDRVVFTNTIDSLRNNGIYRFDKKDYGTGSAMVDLQFMGIKMELT